jgi:Ser/Thr protein kinase RdoA (MazF antagonist)
VALFSTCGPSEEKFVFRCNYALARPLPRLRAELAILTHLQHIEAVEAPTPLENGDGRLWTTHSSEGRTSYSCLFNYISGDRPQVPTPSLMRSLGRLFAHLHRELQNLPTWVPEARSTLLIEQLVGPKGVWGDPTKSVILSRSSALITEAVDACLRRSDVLDEATIGLIHADLHLGNVLMGEDGPCPIDFDDCGIGYLAYDFAVLLREISWHEDFAVLREGLRAGYQSAGGIWPSDEAIDLLVIARRLQSAAWLYERREEVEHQPELASVRDELEATLPRFIAGGPCIEYKR